MDLLIFAFFIAPLVIIAAIVLAIKNRVSPFLKKLYLGFTLLTAAALFYTSYFHVYYSNPNTKVHGWPFSYLVFQRRDSTSPWLDYVGSPLLTYPASLVLFLTIPSLLLLIWMFFSRDSH